MRQQPSVLAWARWAAEKNASCEDLGNLANDAAKKDHFLARRRGSGCVFTAHDIDREQRSTACSAAVPGQSLDSGE